MEDAHWGAYNWLESQVSRGLNPYFGGRCSLRDETLGKRWRRFCLNPYFGGRCSLSRRFWMSKEIDLNSLNPYFGGRCSLRIKKSWKKENLLKVLILILVEDAHWAKRKKTRWFTMRVLILILVEDAHWDADFLGIEKTESVLILILVEDAHWDNYEFIIPQPKWMS